jgi:hypothetical protein
MTDSEWNRLDQATDAAIALCEEVSGRQFGLDTLDDGSLLVWDVNTSERILIVSRGSYDWQLDRMLAHFAS